MAKEYARCLIGSQNYHLDTPESDFDYKVIMIPTFQDLYTGAKVALPQDLDPAHYSQIDIRRFSQLLGKGNPNSIEMVFSTLIEKKLTEYGDLFTIATQAYNEGYVGGVWPQFWAAVKGLVFESVNRALEPRKGFARAGFWLNFTKYVMMHNFVITSETWNAEEVWLEPRNYRLLSAAKIEINDLLSEIERAAPEYLAAYRENSEQSSRNWWHETTIATTTKNIVWRECNYGKQF